MVTLLGEGLVYWTGILTGIFFVSSFLGCRCFSGLKLPKALDSLNRNHNALVWLAFLFFLAHLTFAVLGANFGIWL